MSGGLRFLPALLNCLPRMGVTCVCALRERKMVALEEISRIGFGGYRIGNGDPSHANALRKAIAAGCNVVDTASTYTSGASETLIGNVLREGCSSRAFVITKAGYASGIALQSLLELQGRGLATDSFVRPAEDFCYSLSPDFLLCQIEISRRRLGVKCLDAFLVHNPEHLLALYKCENEFYAALGKVFGFLEELVDEGLIRHYGVSSNRFAVTGESFAVDLRSMLEAAASSGCQRMHMLQLPFNLLEQNAICKNLQGQSVVSLARGAQLKIFSNRPFNAMSRNGFLRLAAFDGDDASPEQVARCSAVIQECLFSHDANGDNFLANMPGLAYALERWETVDNSDAVKTLFEHHVLPEVRSAFKHGPPEVAVRAIADLYRLCDRRCRINMAANARAALEGTYDELLNHPDGLQAAACAWYFKCGIDCVLVGMRREEYVRDMMRLLR